MMYCFAFMRIYILLEGQLTFLDFPLAPNLLAVY